MVQERYINVVSTQPARYVGQTNIWITVDKNKLITHVATTDTDVQAIGLPASQIHVLYQLRHRVDAGPTPQRRNFKFTSEKFIYPHVVGNVYKTVSCCPACAQSRVAVKR